MIEINHLVKKYGDHVAVNDLSLKVEDGKIYGFLGPNGAGKSTTMNIITGYIGATSGEVIVNGYDILKDPEKAKRGIGYLPEIPPLYVDMTVLEYLEFVAELKKIPKEKREDYLDETMEMTRLTEYENRLIKNLSKGYRQRVGLAQAILGYPEVIILDEPTVGLDPKQITEIRTLIKKLGEKHTVILSSHIMQEISAVCDYVFIISKGELVASDTIENISTEDKSRISIETAIKGDKSDISKVLDKFNAIKECKFVKKDSNGIWTITLETDKSKDIREDLFYALAEAKLPIMELKHQERSLESVFLELTEDSDDSKINYDDLEEEE